MPIWTSSASASGPGVTRLYSVPLIGPIDGSNNSFTTPDFFDNTTICVYLNGVRLLVTSDYSLSESGGAGTGFDTVTILRAKLPRSGDFLNSDYDVV